MGFATERCKKGVVLVAMMSCLRMWHVGEFLWGGGGLGRVVSKW